MDSPPDLSNELTVDLSITERPGDEIGPFKLLQQIGEGGMGVVFMAEQKRPIKRRVALKIVKPGMDTKAVIGRFEAERQAVALMDHPNIARVLDVGTTHTGRPYFVMELVKGMPVTQYCDEHRLTTRERLELFIPICQAVQHAHQKGIVHRDIKPSNILVAEYDHRAVPKIIDFGIAKALHQQLTEKTVFTQLGQVIGTLEYMSPEQAKVNQLDVDTRSDIYSLGVVLYELLTGNTPFDKRRLRDAAWEELLRIIREEEPLRPSMRLRTSAILPALADSRKTQANKLSASVRGDLDWIVMKALDKERERRFETASSFADDIRRYLNDEPVLSCPPSAGYRLRKFAHKNRAALLTASTLMVALFLGLAGFAGTSWQMMRAAQANEAAMRFQLETRATSQEAMNNVGALHEHLDKRQQLDSAICRVLNRIGARLRQTPADETELQAFCNDLFGIIIDYWNTAVDIEHNSLGDPGPNYRVYRLQRAIAFARASEHVRADAEVKYLRQTDWFRKRQLLDFARVFALCAASTEDTDEGKRYAHHAVTCLAEAIDEADHLSDATFQLSLLEDPEFQSLRSYPDFRDLMKTGTSKEVHRPKDDAN